MDARTFQLSLEFVSKGSCDVYVLSKDYVNIVNYTGKDILLGCNTSSQGEEGTHWCIFYIYKTSNGIVSEFYDSYARPPSYYSIIHPYQIVWYNQIVQQTDNSSLCGGFCIYFAFCRLRKNSIQHGCTPLSSDKVKNERIVVQFFNCIMKKGLKEKIKLRSDIARGIICKSFGCYPDTQQRAMKRKFEDI